SRPRSSASTMHAVRASRSCAAMGSARGSERVRAGLAGPDSVKAFDGHDPHLAVADLAGPSRFHDALRDARRFAVLDQDLYLDLRHEVDRVLGAAVHLGVPTLAPEPLHLGDGEAVHTQVLYGALDVIELERLDDTDHEFHAVPLFRGPHSAPPLVPRAPQP